MDRLNLYPEMNKEIVNIFRLSDDNPMNLYAAQLIETQASEIEALKAENARLSRERDACIEDFQDYATQGSDNFASFCANADKTCVDKRGWCIDSKCNGRRWRGADKGV